MNKEPKYPLSSTRIAFIDDFEFVFKRLWDEIAERISISQPQSYDMKIFFDQKDLFYHKLFANDTENLNKFEEIYKSFQVWWESIAGQMSIERSISENLQEVYNTLAEFLPSSGVEPQKSLKISLVYDECLLANSEVSSYFAVLPIRDFILNNKMLIPKLQNCFY